MNSRFQPILSLPRQKPWIMTNQACKIRDVTLGRGQLLNWIRKLVSSWKKGPTGNENLTSHASYPAFYCCCCGEDDSSISDSVWGLGYHFWCDGGGGFWWKNEQKFKRREGNFKPPFPCKHYFLLLSMWGRWRWCLHVQSVTEIWIIARLVHKKLIGKYPNIKSK